ncbi:gamma-glutamylcyclotransferase family protein [uncultured Roseobacter sp.]|uniref:gamma-glutamylcyclotransferase family protein n=1 Tax=uncultured Roseobacter sp. TaxID=114847 RepID=UPI00262D69A2|nr:gamma-glutamylcyclotransferase family protein [uncultured Roseobacter sp.]
MTFLYFAYGSNMLSSRLTARCSSARVLGAAVAKNHTIEFTKPSKDKSGKATLIPSAGPDVHTFGVLFEIKKVELKALDKAEGAGYGYERHDGFSVIRSSDSDTVKAATYLANEARAELRPFDWYLALVVAGALAHKLANDHVDNLLAVPYELDADTDRQSRREALEALRKHGYFDHVKLLRR